MDDLIGPPAKANILIADDTAANLQLLSVMLESNGFCVIKASDGRSALALARELLPDLILLDIRMPGMDGYDVCRQLKLDPATYSTPVIFVSALDEQTDKVQGFAVGGVDYITKPFQSKEVLARVETHLTLRNLQRQLETQNLQLQQEIRVRKKVEEALKQANEELEERVQARTAELSAANEILNKELQMRRQTEEALLKSQAEREALLEQVREQAQQVREIMNSVPEGVLLLADDGQIMLANPTAQKDLKNLFNLKVGEILVQLGDKALGQLLNSPPQGLWHEISAAERAFEVIARPTTLGEDNQYWVMVLRDVTHERELQTRSQQQERLAAVGQLAAGIAHDFNNILAVILLYTEMALDAPDLDRRLRERLFTILQQSRRASDLIQQVLDFSRRTRLERRPMDLQPFFKEQVKLLERTLPENIRIELNFEAGPWVMSADPTRMQQAIMNLAVNARDAMPDGGRLSIRLGRVSALTPIHCIACGTVTGREWIHVMIADNGAGIAPEVLPHIFEPFFTTKTQGQGTGLGLSQVFGIVETHDGHVDVSSSEDQGATFSLYLPALAAKSYTEPDTDASSFIRGMNQTILVVEDDPVTRQALMEGLNLLNYHVVCTSDGSEAARYLAEHAAEVDLVLSDVVMPEMGGIPLLQKIRRDGLKIPVILMTGHPLQNELENMPDDGLTTWLLKPPRLKQLAKLIGEALRAPTGQGIKP
ncbi:MAG: response regulator [Anaerolineales bacterium]|nr:response regulator [Anaerolineales bacterium]